MVGVIFVRSYPGESYLRWNDELAIFLIGCGLIGTQASFVELSIGCLGELRDL